MLVRVSIQRTCALVAIAVSCGTLSSCAGGSAPIPSSNAPLSAAHISYESQGRAADSGTASQPPAAQNEGAPIPLNVPVGLAVNGGNDVFVANHSGTTGQVLVYSPSGAQLTSKTVTAGINIPPASLSANRGTSTSRTIRATK